MKTALLGLTALISTFAQAGEKTITCVVDTGYSIKMITDGNNNLLECSETYPGRSKKAKATCTPLEMGFAAKNYYGDASKLYKTAGNFTNFVFRGYTTNVVHVESGESDVYNVHSYDQTVITKFWIETTSQAWLNSTSFDGTLRTHDEEDGGSWPVDVKCSVEN